MSPSFMLALQKRLTSRVQALFCADALETNRMKAPASKNIFMVSCLSTDLANDNHCWCRKREMTRKPRILDT